MAATAVSTPSAQVVIALANLMLLDDSIDELDSYMYQTVRYVMRLVSGDPKNALPPLQKLSSEAVVSVLWEGEGSLVQELLQSTAPHVEIGLLNNLKPKICAHNPFHSDDLERELRKSLLGLRDEFRSLPYTYKCRHDAVADLIHICIHNVSLKSGSTGL